MLRCKAVSVAVAFSGVLAHSSLADPGDFIDLFVTSGSGGLHQPRSLMFRPDGNLYVTGWITPFSGDQGVVRYDGVTGEFIDVFTSGVGVVGLSGMDSGPDGHLYVTHGSYVERYDGITGAHIDTFVSAREVLDEAWHLTFGPDGNLYVSSNELDLVARFDGTSGEFIDVFALDGGLSRPTGLVFGPDDNLYVASGLSYKVLRYNGTTGEFIDVFAGGPEMFEPVGLDFGPDGHLYVCNGIPPNILRYHGTTGVLAGVFASGPLYWPYDLTFGPDGNLYVADRRSGYPPTGAVARFEGPSVTVIPAVSTWGLTMLGLLVLTGGTVAILRRKAAVV